jgi:GNAT superfamily N-acetyltransferase
VGFYCLIADAVEPELDLLFVSDDMRGCVVGSALLAHLKAVAVTLGIGAIRIVSHPPALRFYLNAGAQQEGVVPPRGRVSWERPLLRLRVSAA